MSGPIVFETDRLSVRKWSEGDQAYVQALYGQTDVVRWVDDGQPITPDEVERWMVVTRDNYAKRGYGMFLIEDRLTSEMVGCGGIVHPGNQPEPEIKYAFQPKVWEKGIASEFVRGLMHYGQSTHGLTHFIATVASPNLASIRVLEKAGLGKTGVRLNDDGSETVVLEWRADGSHP